MTDSDKEKTLEKRFAVIEEQIEALRLDIETIEKEAINIGIPDCLYIPNDIFIK